MNNHKPAFHPIANLLTTLAILLTTEGFALCSLQGGGASLFEYLLPTLILIVAVGMRFAAPSIPWYQLVLLIVIVFAIHLLAEHFVPFMLVAEKVIEVVCVFGFGACWVRKGYIPRGSNRW